MGAVALQGRPQILQEGLDRPRRQGIVGLAGRAVGIGAGAAMHPVQLLGPLVVGRQLVVAHFPGGHRTLLQGLPRKLPLAHPLQHRPPDLAVAAEGVDGLGVEGIAIGAEPHLAGVVAVLAEQIHIGHILIGQGHGTAALEQQHPPPRGRQLAHQRAAAGATADHDHVVVLVVDNHRHT